MLVDIVAKGGNLLLNIAPSPEGEWQEGAYALLKEYGDWMDINSEAIYNSNTLAPYKEDNICMTQQENGDMYFFYMAEEDETVMPSEIVVNALQPAKGSKVSLLGSDLILSWKPKGNGFSVSIPKELQTSPPCKYVWILKVEK
jgi:alpha-L-fucosidase